jgi:hypothetical protein
MLIFLLHSHICNPSFNRSFRIPMPRLRKKPGSAYAAGTRRIGPVLAAAVALSGAIWTEDTDFFGSGIAVWTSDRIEIFLKEQLKSLEADRT